MLISCIMLKILLQLLRPHHWTKNLFVLAPLVFAKKLFVLSCVTDSLIGFGLFCLAASASYILNDIKDIESDRRHPKKKDRPLAADAISIKLANILAAGLGMISIALSFQVNILFGLLISAYLITNILYSLLLKRIVVLDVLCISAGFILRVLAGAVIINVPASKWLIICTFFLSLFLALGKRRSEIMALGAQADSLRPVLAHYNPKALNIILTTIAVISALGYIVYTFTPATISFFNTWHLVLTIPFVLFGVTRYLYLMHEDNQSGDPTDILLADWPMMVNIFLWTCACILIIYGNN